MFVQQFVQADIKNQRFALLVPCAGQQSVTSGFTAQRASKKKRNASPCHDVVILPIIFELRTATYLVSYYTPIAEKYRSKLYVQFPQFQKG